jgi:hypothetical protein
MEACAMPAHHRLRPDDGKCITGIWKQPADPAQNHPSLAENGNRPTLPRRSTMICCRSTRIKASSVARDRHRSKTRQKISLMRPNIRASVTRFCAPRQPDPSYDSDNDRSWRRRSDIRPTSDRADCRVRHHQGAGWHLLQGYRATMDLATVDVISLFQWH